MCTQVSLIPNTSDFTCGLTSAIGSCPSCDDRLHRLTEFHCELRDLAILILVESDLARRCEIADADYAIGCDLCRLATDGYWLMAGAGGDSPSESVSRALSCDVVTQLRRANDSDLVSLEVD